MLVPRPQAMWYSQATAIPKRACRSPGAHPHLGGVWLAFGMKLFHQTGLDVQINLTQLGESVYAVHAIPDRPVTRGPRCARTLLALSLLSVRGGGLCKPVCRGSWEPH